MMSVWWRIGLPFLALVVVFFPRFSVPAVVAATFGAPVIKVYQENETEGKVVGAEYTVGGYARVTLRTDFPQGSIFYTLDGSEPSFTSTRYQNIIQFYETTTVRAIAYSVDFTQSARNQSTITVVPRYTLRLEANPYQNLSYLTANPVGGRYNSNTLVSVTAPDRNGWVFQKWTGAIESSNSTVQVWMDTNKVLKAWYATTLKLFTNGPGSIVAEPPGPYYSYGEKVRLNALANAGAYFGAWGGVIQDSWNPAVLEISAPTQFVSAVFAPLQEGQVSLNLIINGRGRFEVEPQRFVFMKGETVTIKAFRELPYRPLGDSSFPGASIFHGWSGDASGFANPLTLTMDANKSIKGTFRTFERGVRVLTEPLGLAIGNNGNIIVSDRARIVSLSSDGKVVWEKTAPPAYGPPVVGKSGTIYLPTGRQITALSPEGEVLWNFPAEPHSENAGTPSIGPGETVYVNFGDRLYAIRDGVSLASTPAIGPALIGPDGTIYVKGVTSLTPDLKTNWVREAGSPVAVSWNNLVFGSSNNNVVVLSPAGEVTATLPLDRPPISVVLTEAGNVLIADGFTAYLYRPTGELLRKAGAAGSPLLAKAGGEYYLLRTGNIPPPPGDSEVTSAMMLHSYAQNGSLHWSYEIEYALEDSFTIFQPTVLGGEGTVAFFARINYSDQPEPYSKPYLKIVNALDLPARSAWLSEAANAQNTRWAEPPVRTLETSVLGSGTISRFPDLLELSLNSSVTLTANPHPGASFLRWEGDISSTNNPVMFSMVSHKKVVGVFTEAPAAAKLAASREGDGLRVQAVGSGGIIYELQDSSDLKSWSRVQEFQGTLDVLLPPTFEYRFYRVITR